MNYQSSSTDKDTLARMKQAQLEAIRISLLDELDSKKSYIATLEDRLLNMSVELASSRTREDEQLVLLHRRSTQLSYESDDDDLSVTVPDEDDENNIKHSPEASATESSSNRLYFSFMSSWGSTKGDQVDDLRVDFPKGGRRSHLMDEYSVVTEGSSCQDQRRRTLTDLLFNTREAIREEARLHRNKNLNNILHRNSARNIGSTVLFPRVDDDYSLGFE